MEIKHLCTTCKQEFVTCKNENIIVWGIDLNPNARGAEADAVIKCDGYKEKPNEQG